MSIFGALAKGAFGVGKATFTGGFAARAAIGAGIGWLSADNDENIRFKTNHSVIRLKEYARYHFKQDKPFDEYYYEINE